MRRNCSPTALSASQPLPTLHATSKPDTRLLSSSGPRAGPHCGLHAWRLWRTRRHGTRGRQNPGVLFGRQSGGLRFRAVHDQHGLRRRRARSLRHPRRIPARFARSGAGLGYIVGRVGRCENLHVPSPARRQVPDHALVQAHARFRRGRRRLHVQTHDRPGQCVPKAHPVSFPYLSDLGYDKNIASVENSTITPCASRCIHRTWYSCAT